MGFYQSCNTIFKPIYDYFNKKVFDISFFKFENIYYTDDMENDVMLFCTPKEFECINNFGVTILPNENLKEMVILIEITSKDLITYACTLIHELVHVCDFKIFADQYLSGTFDNIYDHTYYRTYANWSEFKAFSISEYHKYKYIDTINNTNYCDTEVMSLYPESLKEFLLKEHENMMIHGYSLYNLSEALGYIYMLDNYNRILDISDSIAFEYISILFRSERKYQIFELYKEYFVADGNQNIFERIERIQAIENQVFLEV